MQLVTKKMSCEQLETEFTRLDDVMEEGDDDKGCNAPAAAIAAQ